jgi:Rrf2 family protein
MTSRAKSHYAAVAMLELAVRAEEPQPISVRDIAAEHDVPLAFLNQIFQQLKVAGLVTSVRGSAGGYRLQRSASMITLAEIIDAVSPNMRTPSQTPRSLINQVLEKTWEALEQANHDRLDAFRLDQLVQEVTRSQEGMFYI